LTASCFVVPQKWHCRCRRR